MSTAEIKSLDRKKQDNEQKESADSPYLDAIDSPDDLNSLDDKDDKSQDADKFQDAEDNDQAEVQIAVDPNEKADETENDKSDETENDKSEDTENGKSDETERETVDSPSIDTGAAAAVEERMEVDDTQALYSDHDEPEEQQQGVTHTAEQQSSDEVVGEQSTTTQESTKQIENTTEVKKVSSNNNGPEETSENAVEPMEVDESDGVTSKKASSMAIHDVENDSGDPEDSVMEHDPEQLNCSDLSEPADSNENDKTVSDDPFEALKSSTVNNDTSTATISAAKESVNASSNSPDVDSDDEVANDTNDANDNENGGDHDENEENEANEAVNDGHIEGIITGSTLFSI